MIDVEKVSRYIRVDSHNQPRDRDVTIADCRRVELNFRALMERSYISIHAWRSIWVIPKLSNIRHVIKTGTYIFTIVPTTT